ncbi:MAG TPA: ABC transporter substrate-binding protein [Candidatus Acidoferrales bacterium]|nr:ABC transporter substrate-binding protein [Candidatus Acidoferrales bacterium]
MKVQFAGVPTDDMTPIYWAIKTGMYAKEGIDLEIVATASGTIATTAVVAGSYQLGKGSLIASLVAHLRNLPITVIACGSIWDKSVLFNEALVAADSTIRTGADLNGKTAATPALNDLNQLVISTWVDKNGGDSKTMKWIEFPNSGLGAALADHRIDVAAMQEPQLSAEIATGHVRALAPVYNAISEHFCFADVFANKPWAEANADVVKRWVRTTYAAAAYTNTHHAETVQMMADVTKIPAATIASMARVQGATSSDPSLMQPCIDAAAKYKMIPNAFPAKDLFS